MAFRMQSGGDQSGQWSVKQLLPRIAAIVVGTIFLVVGLSRLRQPSLQGGGVSSFHINMFFFPVKMLEL